MATIQLRDVSRVFAATVPAGSPDEVDRVPTGTIAALDRVTLTVPDGETVAVVGPSGCGKSTLLRVVAGLDASYTGQVLYDDEDVRDTPPGDRYIGMVFQNYALYPHFLGRGNLAFFFHVHKAPDEETEERIRVTAEIMGLGFKELLKRRPGTLSGGEQQRLAIGRAIVRNPRLFLLDEPLSNLDAKLRAQTRVEIKRLLRRFRITAIYVTHDQVEATTLGDQIAVMRAGRVEQAGTQKVLRERPANAFVAGFLGSPPMNLLEGGTVGGGVLHVAGIEIPLSDRAAACLSAGQEVTIGLRPEVTYLSTDRQTRPGSARLPGTVEAIEPDFARRSLLAHMRSGSLSWAATGPLDARLSIGDRVEAVLPMDQLYLFDSSSGAFIGRS